MKTIPKGAPVRLKFQVNPKLLNQNEFVSLRLISPSRPEILLENKPVTKEGAGFFSIFLSNFDTFLLIDDTYKYSLEKDNLTLDYGRVRLVKSEIADNGTFDYLLDLLLA